MSMVLDGFGRSILFAAVAAAGASLWLTGAGPLLGMRPALVVFLVGAGAAYAAGIVPTLRGRVRAALGAALAGGVVALVARSIPELVLGLTVVLAVVRSGFAHPRPLPRALAIEAGLGVAATAFARHLAGPTIVSVALAVWGYLVIQSMFFLVPRSAEAGTRKMRGSDPFDVAHARALALLDDEG